MGIVHSNAVSTHRCATVRGLHRTGIRCTIARRRDERRRGPFNREAYRQHNVVERCINRLKQFRRVATRYEKRGANFDAMVTLAVITRWL
jgi:transposase